MHAAGENETERTEEEESEREPEWEEFHPMIQRVVETALARAAADFDYNQSIAGAQIAAMVMGLKQAYEPMGVDTVMEPMSTGMMQASEHGNRAIAAAFRAALRRLISS